MNEQTLLNKVNFNRKQSVKIIAKENYLTNPFCISNTQILINMQY